MDLSPVIDNPKQYASKVSIKELSDLLIYLADKYYNTDNPAVSDDIYDILYDTLKQRDPTNIFLKSVGALNKHDKNKIKLPYFMGSLDKIKFNDSDELNTWLNKYPGPYLLSDKLDGVSALYIKINQEHKLYTRGNGQFGYDISHLIPYVMHNNINFDQVPDKMAVRGELIITKDNFLSISKKYKNARNLVSGLVNSKTISTDVAKITSFVAYNLINPIKSINEQYNILKEYKFPIVENKLFKKINTEILNNYLLERKKISTYEMDGIVVFDSSKIHKMTNLKKNPDYAFAFKNISDNQVTETTVEYVDWNVSKDNYLKPRLKIKQINLVGVDIDYVTCFNAKYVVDNNIGPGAIVQIVRSGDVIPHILKVVKMANEPQMPDVKYVWNDTKVDLIAIENTDQATVKQIERFFEVLDVMNISTGIITKLVDNDFDTIEKILTADKKDLYLIDGLGEVIINKIYTNIDEAFKKVNLIKLMAASNIFGRGFGEKKIKIILEAYPDIMDKKWTKQVMIDNILLLDGYDVKTATKFSECFNEFKKFYNRLNKIYNLDSIKIYQKDIIIKKEGDKLIDKKIVFTGFRDKNLESVIKKRGGLVSGSVSSKTNILVYADGETNSNKYLKAIELGVQTMTIDEFNEYIK
jgi:NAD-dependent DNA ligase